MKTFKELLEKHSNETIIKKLIELYPDQNKNKDGYEKALQELKSLKPKADKMVIVLIRVRKSKKWDIDEPYVDVHGKSKGDEIGYGLSFTPWEKLLGMKIKSYFNQIEVLAHCLWEFTWYGYSNKEVSEDFKKLSKRADEARKQIK